MKLKSRTAFQLGGGAVLQLPEPPLAHRPPQSGCQDGKGKWQHKVVGVFQSHRREVVVNLSRLWPHQVKVSWWGLLLDEACMAVFCMRHERGHGVRDVRDMCVICAVPVRRASISTGQLPTPLSPNGGGVAAKDG